MPKTQLSLFLADRLRALRERHGLTQEAAANLIACDYKYYQAMEAGSKDLRLSMIERIASAFGIEGAELFSRKLPETCVVKRERA